MKVLLISANKEQINIPPVPIGMASVATAVKNAGHDVEMVDLMDSDNAAFQLTKMIKEFSPRIIGISVRNIDDQNTETSRFLLEEVKAVINECKRLSDAPIVLGGAGYSIFPKSSLAYLGADMGIQGEGEVAFTSLIERIQNGADLSGVPGLYIQGRGLQGKREFVKDLDTLPLPDPSLFTPYVPEGHELWLPFQTRRGCPMNCSYCSTATIEGRHIRKHSPDFALDNIIQWANAGIHDFFFVDNTFNIPLSYAKAICKGLIERELNISWRSILYPLKLDEGLVKDMAKAGCKTVSVGFESGCTRILKGMNKRFHLDDIRHTSKLLADYGIERLGFLLLGGPGETRTSVEESLVFADSLNLDSLKLTTGIRIYPDTSLSKIAMDEGIISPKDDLLFPRFYIIKEIEDWLKETVDLWIEKRPNWIT
ncbi:MAG: cobalamin-dependent protein [Thermodesulfobacteriota bacterium]|nr:cobalamin-dependent protein [Thermodesulfobacteriota bacterium]